MDQERALECGSGTARHGRRVVTGQLEAEREIGVLMVELT